jgi:hypothetical protein
MKYRSYLSSMQMAKNFVVTEYLMKYKENNLLIYSWHLHYSYFYDNTF